VHTQTDHLHYMTVQQPGLLGPCAKAMEEFQPLTFISGDTKGLAAREAIRVHVTRRQHRQRKLRERVHQRPDTVYTANQSFQVWPSPILTPSPHATPKEAPVPVARVGCRISESPSEGTCGDDTGSFPGQLSPSDTDGHKTFSWNHERVQEPQPLAQNLEAILVQYYLQSSGGSSFTRDLFKAYGETTGSYHAFLALIATKYSVDKGESLPVYPTEMENLALREVANQLSRSPSAPATHTMLTVAMLANYRELRQEHELVKCHWSALRQMIGINGGVQRLRTDQALYNFLLWMEAVVLSEVEASISESASNSGETERSKSEMVEFFAKVSAHTLASKASGQVKHTKISTGITKCLSTPAHQRDPYSISKWYHARLVSLIYLAALSLHDASTVEYDTGLQEASADLTNRQQQYTVYPEELVYVFVRACNQDDRCSISWLVARICCDVKQLDQSGKNTCQRLLTEYLGYDDPFAFDLCIKEWEALSATLILAD
jgi:hypothetical protein